MAKNLNVLGFFNKNNSTLFASTTNDKVDSEVVIGHFNLSYSPQLNPIEMVWKFMKYYWIELDAYKSAKNMENYVEKVIQGYGVDYEIKFT